MTKPIFKGKGPAQTAVLLLSFITLSALFMIGLSLLVVGVLYIFVPTYVAWGFGIISFALFLYLLPTYIARAREHDNAASIFVINFFFGWTLIGWVIALAWAVKN